jgi:hypothetical protein
MGIAYNPRIVTDGLVLCLDAANSKSYPGSGTAWTDLSGNQNDGTLVNGVGFSSDNKGALVFDGVDDYVDCGASTYLNNTLAGLTVCVWIRVGALGLQIYAENGTEFQTNTFYIAQENSSNLSFLVANDAGQYQRIYGTSSYTTNTWYNFVGVWSSGQNLKAYVNGVDTSRDLLNPFGVLSTIRTGNSNLWLGRRPNGGLVFIGRMPQMMIYNRALTAQEIQQNFNATRGRYGI